MTYTELPATVTASHMRTGVTLIVRHVTGIDEIVTHRDGAASLWLHVRTATVGSYAEHAAAGNGGACMAPVVVLEIL